MDIVTNVINQFFNSPFTVIIDSEAVALLRHFIGKFISKYIYTKENENKKYNEVYLLAIRVGVSCIAFFIYKKSGISDFQDEFTRFFLVLFIYIIVTRIFKLGEISYLKGN